MLIAHMTADDDMAALALLFSRHGVVNVLPVYLAEELRYLEITPFFFPLFSKCSALFGDLRTVCLCFT